MARNPELDAALGAINVATNRLGEGVTALQTGLDGASTRVFAITELIKTQMTAAEVAEARSVIDAETNRIDNAAAAMGVIAVALNGIAANPTAPVPEPVPEPVDDLPDTPVEP